VATFAYTAKNDQGNRVTGTASAETVDEMVARLHAQGLAVLEVTERRGLELRRDLLASLRAALAGKASTRDLAIFSRQLATVLESGIPIARGLRGLSSDGVKGVMGKVIPDLAVRLERGETVSDAMAAHPEAFPPMYRSMIRAGERAGTLDRIVAELAVYLEKVDDLQGKVKAAMSYPLFILGFTLLATLFLVLQVVPTFSGIYKELGQDLPGITQLVLNFSDSIRHQGLLWLLGIGIVLLAGWAAMRLPQVRYGLDAALLRLPVFGTIITKSVMSRFARTLGILVGSGLPILESLELVKGAADNLVVIDATEQAQELITAGHGVTEAFQATGKFPELVIQLMATGEEAGDLDGMLLKAAEFYDRQVEGAVHSISSLIEPLMIVLVGGVIGFIVISMFMPIFKMGDAMMKGGGF